MEQNNEKMFDFNIPDVQDQNNENLTEYNIHNLQDENADLNNTSNIQLGEIVNLDLQSFITVLPRLTNISNSTFQETQTDTLYCSRNETNNQLSVETQNGDLELKSLLKYWDLENLFDRLRNVGISIKQLKQMRINHIDEFFEPVELGQKIMFQYHLTSWQKGFQTEITSVPSPSVAPPESSSHTTNSVHVAVTTIINKNKEIGQSIRDFYEKNGVLEPRHRDILCSMIVDFYLKELNLKPASKQIKGLADEIVLCFPSESSKTYYTTRHKSPTGSKKSPTGKLYNKFDYENRKILKYFGVAKTTPDERSISTAQENIEQEEYLSLKMELRNLRSPWSLVTEKWTKSSKLRVTEYMSNVDQSIINIFNEWPILKHAFMPDLVEIDFLTLYPSAKNIYTKWDFFLNNVALLLKSHTKQKENITSLTELLNKKDEISSDAYNLQILYLLSSLLPPSVKNKSQSKDTVKYGKSSVKDSQTWFVKIISSVSDIPKELREITSMCKEENAKFQPLLLAIGQKWDLKEFIILIDGHKYLCGSLLEALDKLFKIYQVFKLEYPTPCFNIWLFIQLYFYEIETPYDVEVPCINTLINDLNNRYRLNQGQE